MATGDQKGPFLYNLPPSVLWDFCRVMDGFSDLDWTRFASEVLGDQTAVRLAERRERRTDWVMNQWGSRNGLVRELVDLLERLQFFRPRDVILEWLSSLKPSCGPRPVALSQFDPPPKQQQAPPTEDTYRVDEGGGRPLPRPAPPPPHLESNYQPQLQPPSVQVAAAVMCWSYEEVHAGTQGFSPSLQVGEGGFGVVYRATLRKTDCAVKRLKQDCLLDWNLLKESFQTEVDKLTKFRHPNIVDLLGFSEGGGSVCLIYSFMENRSLEDQLHNPCVSLSWAHRLAVVKGAAKALQFLHCPPDGHQPLIHGDVKSSNILLDHHLEAKLADFGLARFAYHSAPGLKASQTTTVGRTETIRGTLAYLPDEYVRNGELGPAVDVYSFGVVLLEVLTGRRALEKDRKSREWYLKDLVAELEEAADSAAAWRRQVDRKLLSGGAAEPAGCLEVAALACRCLDRSRKRRPAMTRVFDRLVDIQNLVKKSGSSSLPRHHLPQPGHFLPRPPSLDSTVTALSQQLSQLGPLEDTYRSSVSSSSASSSSSSSSSSLPPPHPLHSSSSLPPVSLPPSSSSFTGPCETDESRGFSQYDLRPQSSSVDSRVPRSIPTEDRYSAYQSSTTSSPSESRSQKGAIRRPGPVIATAESLSPVRSLRSVSPEPSGPRFLQQNVLSGDGRIQTPELLSSDDIYGRRPEESDELSFLPAEHD
ncbi:uncharacterized protein V6R79_021507 [Siganus canaliculatus]